MGSNISLHKSEEYEQFNNFMKQILDDYQGNVNRMKDVIQAAKKLVASLADIPNQYRDLHSMLGKQQMLKDYVEKLMDVGKKAASAEERSKIALREHKRIAEKILGYIETTRSIQALKAAQVIYKTNREKIERLVKQATDEFVDLASDLEVLEQDKKQLSIWIEKEVEKVKENRDKDIRKKRAIYGTGIALGSLAMGSMTLLLFVFLPPLGIASCVTAASVTTGVHTGVAALFGTAFGLSVNEGMNVPEIKKKALADVNNLNDAKVNIQSLVKKITAQVNARKAKFEKVVDLFSDSIDHMNVAIADPATINYSLTMIEESLNKLIELC